MKKKIGVLLTAALLGSWGCNENLLDVTNENTYAVETYFISPTQYNEAVIGTYAVFSHEGMMSRVWYFLFDLLANEAERSTALQGDLLQLSDYSYTQNNEQVRQYWASLYRMNFRANLAMHVMENWTPVNAAEETLKKQYIAEAHFLRGFAYFNLVTNFGRVPLKLTYESANTNNEPRAAVAEVWKVVEDEFKSAQVDLLASYANDQRGRATKGAATAFLGRTYLFEKKYDLAITELSRLRPGGDLNNYTLDPSYDHLFSEDNINSSEVVFAVNHAYTAGSNQYYMFGGQEGGNARTAHNGRAQEYGWNDWKNVTVSNALVAAFKYANPETGSTYIDPRAKYTFYSGPAEGGDIDYCNSCNSGPLPYPYNTNGNGNRWRKYEPYEIQTNTVAPMSGINTHVMRYADVLLMLAESYIEQGTNVAAGLSLINEVRNRPSVMAVNYPLTLDQTAARSALRLERRIELAGEQSRWFDLNRWGIARDVLNAEHPAGPSQRAFEEKHMLLPIPVQEKSINQVMGSDIANDWN